MQITKEQFEKMMEAAMPLIKWMNENSHPHCTCHVDLCSVKLTEEVAMNKTVEFLKD